LVRVGGGDRERGGLRRNRGMRPGERSLRTRKIKTFRELESKKNTLGTPQTHLLGGGAYSSHLGLGGGEGLYFVKESV